MNKNTDSLGSEEFSDGHANSSSKGLPDGKISETNIWFGDNIKNMTKEDLFESFFGLSVNENSIDQFLKNEEVAQELSKTEDPENAILRPDFDFKTFGDGITKDDVLAEAARQCTSAIPQQHQFIMGLILEKISIIDFVKVLGLSKDQSPTIKNMIVLVVEHILNTAIANGWQICKNNHQVHIFNGEFWSVIKQEPFEVFLGKGAVQAGVPELIANYHRFRSELFLQFMAVAYFAKPEIDNKKVLINLLNGTFEVTVEKQFLRPFNPNDFMKYKLKFAHNLYALAPIFMNYLDRTVPDKNVQMVLAEFIGYVFINTAELKLEKALLLYGSGANGKSVFFEIIYSLFGGHDNVSSFSVYSLTDEKGYYRAEFEHKLLNYASEISSKMNNSVFKALTSGEPVEARVIYEQPFIIANYGKLAFNCNELPKDPEFTNAFFRRFLIVPFDQMIPEAEQDKELAKKIIANELSGVLNWVIAGLQRLLLQRRFTHSDIIENALDSYKKQADNVSLFMEEEQYEKSMEHTIPMKELYAAYRGFCLENGYRSCSNKTFSERLTAQGYDMKRESYGKAVFVTDSFTASIGM